MLERSDVKVGRNDLCPCGSGKKYKKCCLAKDTAPDDSAAARIYAAEDRLFAELTDFLENKFRQEFNEAWADYHFACEGDAFPKPNDDHQASFVAFALFHWDPDYQDDNCTNLAEGGIVARTFLEERAHRLGGVERQILETLMRQPFNFYEVLTCPPAEDFLVQDLWTGEQITISNISASANIMAGDILYAQLLSMADVTIVASVAERIIPDAMKPPILEYREILREDLAEPREFSLDDVRAQQEDLRELYLETMDALNEAVPALNEDGDPFEMHTMTYDVESAQAAFDALSPLAKGVSKQQILEYAEYDSGGRLAQIEFPWTKKGPAVFKRKSGTILGIIRVSGCTLVAEVNSENRAARLRQEIENYLGAAAVYKGTVTQSLGEALEDEPEVPTEQRVQDMKAQLTENPQLRDAVREILQGHVDDWPNHKLPALGDKTPLQAVKDPKARKLVESLVDDYVQVLQQNFPAEIRPDLSSIRKVLNL